MDLDAHLVLVKLIGVIRIIVLDVIVDIIWKMVIVLHIHVLVGLGQDVEDAETKQIELMMINVRHVMLDILYFPERHIVYYNQQCLQLVNQPLDLQLHQPVPQPIHRLLIVVSLMKKLHVVQVGALGTHWLLSVMKAVICMPTDLFLEYK